MRRQAIMIVHYGDQMGGADACHFILFGIQLNYFTGMQLSDFL